MSEDLKSIFDGAQVVRLEPDDIFLIRLRGRATYEVIARIRDLVESHTKRKALVMDESIDASIVRAVEYSPPLEWVCGCNVKRIGPCPTCSAQYQREQREARRA